MENISKKQHFNIDETPQKRKSILKSPRKSRFSILNNYSFHFQSSNFSPQSEKRDSSYNFEQRKFIKDAFSLFKELPEATANKFAKTVTDKLKKSDYSPLPGIFKKSIPSRKPTIIRPYLVQQNTEKKENVENNSLNAKSDKKSEVIKEEKNVISLKEKVEEKIKSMKRDFQTNFRNNNNSDEKKKNLHEKIENEKKNNNHSEFLMMTKFLENKKTIFERQKNNLFILALYFNQNESLLCLSLINHEIKVFNFYKN